MGSQFNSRFGSSSINNGPQQGMNNFNIAPYPWGNQQSSNQQNPMQYYRPNGISPGFGMPSPQYQQPQIYGQRPPGMGPLPQMAPQNGMYQQPQLNRAIPQSAPSSYPGGRLDAGVDLMAQGNAMTQNNPNIRYVENPMATGQMMPMWTGPDFGTTPVGGVRY